MGNFDSYYDPPEYNESLCDICGKTLDICECPECPVCGEVGRLECMTEHGLVVEGVAFDDVIARKHEESLAAEAEASEMEALSIEAERITQEGREYEEQRREEDALKGATMRHVQITTDDPRIPGNKEDWDDFAYDAWRERQMRRR